MLFGQYFHLFLGESIELRNQEISFTDLPLEMDPVFKFLLKIDDSNGSVTAKEHDDVVLFFIFLFSKMEVTFHVDVINSA